MGSCIRYPPPPPPLTFTIPGGAKITSQPENSHDPCGPVGSIFRLATPAFAAVQPVFDIAGFVMALVEFAMCLLALIGAILAVTGNPALAAMFPLPTVKNTADNEPIPGFAQGQDTGVPDVKCAVDTAVALLCKALKLVALVPQLAMIVTIKDTMNALMALLSCVQAKINSLGDALALVPADTGDPVVDRELQCARDATSDLFAHAAGPLAGVMPMAQAIAKAAEPLKHGLPSSVVNVITMAVNLGLIPFPDTVDGRAARQQFADLLTRLQQGLAITIPDFTDLSDLTAKMDELRTQLAPVVAAVDLVQKLADKLQNC